MADPETNDINKWSNLLPDLLQLIVFELDNHKDLLTFRSVCNSWRSVAIADASLTPFPPLFFVPYCDYFRYYYFEDNNPEFPDHDPSSLTFLDPSSCKELTVQRPETYCDYIRATAHGYLILVSFEDDGNGFSDALVSLFNPITRSQIHMPVLHSLLRMYKWYDDDGFRALLSSHPRSDPPPVFAIWVDKKLFFLTLGDDHWTTFELEDLDYDWCTNFREGSVFAYYHNSFFFTSKWKAELKVINIQSLESFMLDVPVEKNMKVGSNHMILFSGELFLLVSNYLDSESDEYKPYATFKLVKESEGQWQWSKEDYINNDCATSGCTFFLSENLSTAVASPGRITCKANCIYNAFGYDVCKQYCSEMTQCVVRTAEFNLPFNMDDHSNIANGHFWTCSTEHHYSKSSKYTWFLPSIS